MKYLVAVLLLAVIAVNSGYGQTTARATRATTKAPVRIPPKATTRGGPVRQQQPTRPIATRAPPATRAPVATTPRRQNPPVGPPQPTRATPPQPTRATPPQPTRATPPQPTRATAPPAATRAPPLIPQQPNPNPVPTVPNVPNVPTVPTTQRFSTRPPRVGSVGIPDSRCPLVQDIRRPVQLPHPTNCERFYKCESGLAIEFQCPFGQHWNAGQNYCDYPNNARCGANNWPQQPNWNQPQQPQQPPNWNQPQQPPSWNQPQQPPMVPQVPDFQHPIDIPLARGK